MSSRYLEAIQARDDLHTWCKTHKPELADWFTTLYKQPTTTEDLALDDFTYCVTLGESYYWSQNILDFIVQCAKTLPDHTVVPPTYLPSRYGFFFLENPVDITLMVEDRDADGEYLIVGYSWGKVTEGFLLIVWICARRTLILPIVMTNIYDGGDALSIDTLRVPTPLIQTSHVSWMVFATMVLFMNQKVLVQEQRILTKKQAKRFKSNASTLSIVHLRKREYKASESEGHKNVEWQYQWAVRGHWRNQPYKSTGKVIPIWINPYWKGDPSKPVKASKTVFAVVR